MSGLDRLAAGDRIDYLDVPTVLEFPMLTERLQRGTVVDVIDGAYGRIQTVFSKPDSAPDGLRVDYHVCGDLVAQPNIRRAVGE